ncbi:MAG: hypothetical protein RJA22_1921 [Verrucomicrobiota bacterium]
MKKLFQGLLPASVLGAVLLTQLSAPAFEVTTNSPSTFIAGTGSAGCPVDGTLASQAQLNSPWDVLPDSQGNVYIADLVCSRVFKINGEDDKIYTIAGTGVFNTTGDGGQATNATLCGPVGLALSPDESELYISEQGYPGQPGGRVIRKVNLATGIITTIAGKPGVNMSSGNGGAATNATFETPFGLTFGPDGKLYVADYNAENVRVIDMETGIITNFFQFSNNQGPRQVAFDAAGTMYYAVANLNKVYKYSPAGGTVVIGDGASAGSTGALPEGVAVDDQGNVYVSCRGTSTWYGGHCIKKIKADGTSTNFGTVVLLSKAGNGSSCVSGATAGDMVVSYPWLMHIQGESLFVAMGGCAKAARFGPAVSGCPKAEVTYNPSSIGPCQSTLVTGILSATNTPFSEVFFLDGTAIFTNDYPTGVASSTNVSMLAYEALVAFTGTNQGTLTNQIWCKSGTVLASGSVSFSPNIGPGLFTLTYTSGGTNGSILGSGLQYVCPGGTGTVVTAVPNTGCSFIKWSDNRTDNPRTDAGVAGNVNVQAGFALNTYTLSYAAGANGTLSGTANQTVNYNYSGTAVTAVPNSGYYFVQWSDNSTQNPRTDTAVQANLSVTATFALGDPSTLNYTGGMYFPAGTTIVPLQAQLGGTCVSGQTLTFKWDSDGDGSYETVLGTAVTDASGYATFNWTVPTGVRLADIEVVYAGSGSCLPTVTIASVVVAGSGDASNGGGYCSNAGGRINFGYTAQVKTTKTGTTVSGELLWHGKNRLKGKITGYTKATTTLIPGTTTGYLVGVGNLYGWNADTRGWVLSATGVSFKVSVADGGQRAIKDKRGIVTIVYQPDYFAMDIPNYVVPGESTTLQQLNGGNLMVK